MKTFSPLQPREIAFGRVVVAAVELLVQEMNELLVQYHHPSLDPPLDFSETSAEIANRVSVLGQRLIHQIGQYEQTENLRRQMEMEQPRDLPF